MPPSLLMVELTQFSMVQKTVVKIDSMVVHSGNLVSKLPPVSLCFIHSSFFNSLLLITSLPPSLPPLSLSLFLSCSRETVMST